MEAARVCPECQAPLEPTENFCAKCGRKLRATVEEKMATLDRMKAIQEKQSQLKKIKSGRGWILAVSIMTLIFGIGVYLVGKNQVESELAGFQAQMALLTPEQREEVDAKLKTEHGLTIAEVPAHDRGMVQMLLVVNVVLSAIFFGLYLWARKNPFAAALIALLIYLSVTLVNAMIEPKSLAQGVPFKILFAAGLISAISAAYKYKKMQENSA